MNKLRALNGAPMRSLFGLKLFEARFQLLDFRSKRFVLIACFGGHFFQNVWIKNLPIRILLVPLYLNCWEVVKRRTIYVPFGVIWNPSKERSYPIWNLLSKLMRVDLPAAVIWIGSIPIMTDIFIRKFADKHYCIRASFNE